MTAIAAAKRDSIVSQPALQAGARGSVEPGPRPPDDLRPFGGIELDEFGELFRRAARRLVADHREAVPERLRFDGAVDRGVELVDDRPRYAGRRDHAAPGRRRI